MIVQKSCQNRLDLIYQNDPKTTDPLLISNYATAEFK